MVNKSWLVKGRPSPGGFTGQLFFFPKTEKALPQQRFF
jgi:hypothetical protein